MKIGISIVEMNGEFQGRKQKVRMVKVRDLAQPSQFGLAPLAPDEAHTAMSEQEQFDAAVARALEELKKKKGL